MGPLLLIVCFNQRFSTFCHADVQILIRISDMFSFSTFGWNGYSGKSVDECFHQRALYAQFPPSLLLSSSCVSDTTCLGTCFAWLCLGNTKFLLVVALELSSSSEVFSSGAGRFAWDLCCALGFGPVGAAPIQTNGSRYQMGWVIWFVIIQPTFFPQGFCFCETRTLVTQCQLQKFRHFKTCLLMLTSILLVFKRTLDGSYLLLLIPEVHGFGGEYCVMMGGVESLFPNMEGSLFDLTRSGIWNRCTTIKSMDIDECSISFRSQVNWNEGINIGLFKTESLVRRTGIKTTGKFFCPNCPMVYLITLLHPSHLPATAPGAKCCSPLSTLFYGLTDAAA